MTGRSEEEGAFKSQCANAAWMLTPLVGFFISRISLGFFIEGDHLKTALQRGLEAR